MSDPWVNFTNLVYEAEAISSAYGCNIFSTDLLE